MPADHLFARLALRIVPVTMIAGVIACQLIAGAGFDVIAETNEDRVVFVAGDLRDAIQPSLDLGLLLPDLGFVPETLRRARDGSPSVLSIDVYDRGRALLYSTDRSGISDVIPPDWDTARRASTAPMWRISSQDVGVVGAVLTNALDAPVADVVLRYDPSSAHSAPAETLLLVGSGLALGALGGLTIAAGIARILRRPRAAIASATAALIAGSPARPTEAADPDAGLARAVSDFLAVSMRTSALFHAAGTTLKAIDDEP